MANQKLWQHEDTGYLTWCEDPGPRWYEVPTINEDELPPNMKDDEYNIWYENSRVLDGIGCRIGPRVSSGTANG